MKKKIQIMLVEDNPEYRHVIHFSMEDDPEVELISQFGTAEAALRSLQNMATRRVPDVILLDINLPGISGLDALPEFGRQIPDTKIIVLTQSENESDILTAIERGAAGYLLKSASIKEIKAGIQTVMNGGASLDSKMARYLLDSMKKSRKKAPKITALSDREIEILTLIAEGLVRKEIGVELNISHKTVANHIAHIFEKLEVLNAPSAVSKAHRIGLFSGD